MKIHIISPPAPDGKKMIREGRCMQWASSWTTIWPPSTMAYCAAVLERHGHEVRVNDCSTEEITQDGFRQLLRDYRPDIVLINTATPSIVTDLELASVVKQECPDAKTAAFGIHVTMLAEECLRQHPDLDFILRGEVENTAAQLVDALAAGNDPRNIPGLSQRDADKILHSPDREFEPNLDSLPYPAWHLVDLSRYVLPLSGKRYLTVTTGRGCPYRCIFCVAQPFYGKKARLRDPGACVQEIKFLIRQYGISDFFFWSETFTLDNEFVTRLCKQILSENLSIRWVCNSRVDTVNLDMLRLMKQAGCWMISYGVESADQQILNDAKKGITIEQAVRAIEWTKEAGISVTVHFVLGLPGETEQTIRQTIEFAQKQKIDFAQFYCATPWPGSELYSMALRNGWLNTRDWRQFEQGAAVISTERLSSKQLTAWRQKANTSFYLRPVFFARFILNLKSPREALNTLKMATSFLPWMKGQN